MKPIAFFLVWLGGWTAQRVGWLFRGQPHPVRRATHNGQTTEHTPSEGGIVYEKK